MAATTDIVFRTLVIAMLVLAAASQRTFVPNGRYGKRAEIPVVVGEYKSPIQRWHVTNYHIIEQSEPLAINLPYYGKRGDFNGAPTWLNVPPWITPANNSAAFGEHAETYGPVTQSLGDNWTTTHLGVYEGVQMLPWSFGSSLSGWSKRADSREGESGKKDTHPGIIFVPNGPKLGKRADGPVIFGVQSSVGSGNEEMPSSIILGERLLASPMYLCTQTGVGDYYRCSRRTGSNFDEPAQ